MAFANLSVCISSATVTSIILFFRLLNFSFIFCTYFLIHTLNNIDDMEHSCLVPFHMFAVFYLFSILFLLSISQILAIVRDHQQVLKERQNTSFSHTVAINKRHVNYLTS